MAVNLSVAAIRPCSALTARPPRPGPGGCGHPLQQVVDQPGIGIDHVSARAGMGRRVAYKQPLGHQVIHTDPAGHQHRQQPRARDPEVGEGVAHVAAHPGPHPPLLVQVGLGE